ncbi:hypothetical protein YC2023_061688 [Brassica napus]
MEEHRPYHFRSSTIGNIETNCSDFVEWPIHFATPPVTTSSTGPSTLLPLAPPTTTSPSGPSTSLSLAPPATTSPTGLNSYSPFKEKVFTEHANKAKQTTITMKQRMIEAYKTLKQLMAWRGPLVSTTKLQSERKP